MVEPQNQPREAILLIGRSGAGKSTILSAICFGDNYNYAEHNNYFKQANEMLGTTQTFNEQYSEKFEMTLVDSVGLGDPNFPMPKWLELLNDKTQSGIRFFSIIIVLEAKTRPDTIDESAFQTIDIAL